jgi:hypothetical protein
MTIKEELSAGLGIKITDWDKAFEELSVKGQITQRVLLELSLILVKRVEALENAQTTVQVGTPTIIRRGQKGSTSLI